MTHTTKFGALGVAALLFFTACKNNSTSESSETKTDSSATTTAVPPPAETQPTPAPTTATAPANPDSNFVVTAAADNMAEMKMLEAGAAKGTSKDLKSAAKMMLADHKKLGAKVKAYAQKKNYALPADDNGMSNDKMSALDSKTKGADWDKAWVDEMVTAHENAISLFERSQNDVKDDELKKAISDALPTLHKHRDMVKSMQDKMNK